MNKIFENKLRELLNRTCMENESDTPDFILADYILMCLDTWAKIVRKRDKWYGRENPMARNSGVAK